MIEPDRLNHAKSVVDKFLEEHSDFTVTEAVRLNFCCKCFKEFDEEKKNQMFDLVWAFQGENEEKIVCSNSCCGE